MNILPDNWHVIITEENKKALCKWRFEKEDYDLPTGYLVGITKDKDGKLTKGHNPGSSVKSIESLAFDFGREISFLEFQQYILKEIEIDNDLSYLETLLKELEIK